MNSSPVLKESRFTATEVTLLKEVTDHLDVWIDHLWEQTDTVMRAHGLVPAAGAEVHWTANQGAGRLG